MRHLEPSEPLHTARTKLLELLLICCYCVKNSPNHTLIAGRAFTLVVKGVMRYIIQQPSQKLIILTLFNIIQVYMLSSSVASRVTVQEK